MPFSNRIKMSKIPYVWENIGTFCKLNDSRNDSLSCYGTLCLKVRCPKKNVSRKPLQFAKKFECIYSGGFQVPSSHAVTTGTIRPGSSSVELDRLGQRKVLAPTRRAASRQLTEVTPRTFPTRLISDHP